MGRMRNLAALVFSLGLAGCGPVSFTPLGAATTQAMATDTTFSTPDVLALVRSLTGESGKQAPTIDPAAIQKANRVLNYAPQARDQAYEVADPIIARYFGMPGKVDQVPRLSGQDLQTLRRTLQPGDVIQCGNNGSFVHGAFYVGDDVIIHALAEPMRGKTMVGVIRETLTSYVTRVERDQIVVLRPTWTPAQLKAGIAYAQGQVGKDYDSLFLTTSSDRFYCTELVYKILTTSKVARIQPRLAGDAWPIVMNEEIRKSPDLKVVYTKNRS